MGQRVRGLLLNISEKQHVCPHIRHAHAIHSATVSTLGQPTKAESDNCLLCRCQLLNISRKKHTPFPYIRQLRKQYTKQPTTPSLLILTVHLSLHLPLCLTSQYSVKTTKYILVLLLQWQLYQNLYCSHAQYWALYRHSLRSTDWKKVTLNIYVRVEFAIYILVLVT